MNKFKEIIEYILADSHFPELKGIGKIDDSLKKEVITKAKNYAAGGKFEIDDRQKLLQSIFDGLGGKEGDKKGYHFKPQTLNLGKDFFPETGLKASDFNPVFNEFKKEYELIKNFEEKAFAETCLALMEKYFTTIPCQVKGLESVSLFDFMKSVAGFVVCLQESDDIILVGGDISGIQSFIYDIISTDASKNLKGRSFYLQLLVDSVIRKILTKLDLFNANLIYSSGGGFYMLMPVDKVEKLNSLLIEINNTIYQTHKTTLHLAIAYLEVKSDTILKHKLIVNPSEAIDEQKTVWDLLIQRINKKHKRKFEHLLIDKFDTDFFNENGVEIGGSQERDVITGEEFLDTEKKLPLDQDEPSDIRKIKKTTKQQIELGKALKNTSILIYSDKPFNSNNLDTHSICDLGYYYFAKNIQEVTKNIDLSKGIFSLITLNKPQDFLDLSGIKSSHAYQFSFYGGNDYPIFELINEKGKFKKDMPKSFSELAGQKEPDRTYEPDWKEPRYKRLGVLRMDVDGLGAIFSSKSIFGNFAKYAVLSRNLDWFFSGYLNTIWEKNPNYKENTQIIYAGGDDLFIIGRWDLLIEMSEDIHKHFTQFSCENTIIGLSGGMAIVPPKFPISKAAKKSEEFEKAAKNHKYLQIEKNAVCFLNEDIALNWKFEYPIVKDLKIKLQQFVTVTENNSLLQRIQAFNIQKKLQEEKDMTQSWRWLLAYDFARFRGRISKEQQAQRDFIDKIKTNIFLDTYEGKKMQSRHVFIQLLSLAARWAELENRTRKQD